MSKLECHGRAKCDQSYAAMRDLWRAAEARLANARQEAINAAADFCEDKFGDGEGHYAWHIAEELRKFAKGEWRMTTAEQNVRAKFEAWASLLGHDLTRSDTAGIYLSGPTRLAWDVWIAARSETFAEVVSLVQSGKWVTSALARGAQQWELIEAMLRREM
jgi:hypothetical protein